MNNNSITIGNNNSGFGIDEYRASRGPSLARQLIEHVARSVAASITQSGQTGDRFPPSQRRPLEQETRRWFAAYRRGPVHTIADDEEPMSAHRKIWLDVVSRYR